MINLYKNFISLCATYAKKTNGNRKLLDDQPTDRPTDRPTDKQIDSSKAIGSLKKGIIKQKYFLLQDKTILMTLRLDKKKSKMYT